MKPITRAQLTCSHLGGTALQVSDKLRKPKKQETSDESNSYDQHR